VNPVLEGSGKKETTSKEEAKGGGWEGGKRLVFQKTFPNRRTSTEKTGTVRKGKRGTMPD